MCSYFWKRKRQNLGNVSGYCQMFCYPQIFSAFERFVAENAGETSLSMRATQVTIQGVLAVDLFVTQMTGQNLR